MDVSNTPFPDVDLDLDAGSGLPPRTPSIPTLETNIINLQPVQRRLPPIRIRRPCYVQDQLPDPVPTLPCRVILIVRDQLKTAVNSLGLWREYLHRPSFDPDSFVPAEDLAKSSQATNQIVSEPAPTASASSGYLHKNCSWGLLTEWLSTGSTTKSYAEAKRLVHDYLLHPEFKLEEMVGYDPHRVAREMDKDNAKSSVLDNFQEASVPIEVPSGSANVPLKTFMIPGLHYRPLTSLIRLAFAHPLATQFHFLPYKLFHTSPHTGETQRVFSEVYNSDVFIKEHDEVQRAKNPPDDPNCSREKVVAALMVWSDLTHLANFGTAKLWPFYMFMGNLSKYVRALPNSGACQHVAYIPSLNDAFGDQLSNWHTKWGKKTHRQDVMTHCKPDYPEKVLLATIRDKGLCLCPQCLVTKTKVPFLGMIQDMEARFGQVQTYLWDKVQSAREWIYKFGRGIKSKAVESLLKETSSVPTVNAFVERLGYSFNLPRMLAPDFMHEFELGVWKSPFTHLIRVLYAARPDGSGVIELDYSLGDYPAFIRLFGPSGSFSTQPGELAHRLVKRLYGITNKRDAAKQIGNHVCRREQAELAQKVRLKQNKLRNVVHWKSIRTSTTLNFEDNREAQWHASINQNNPVDIARLVQSNHGNPTYKNFVRKLKDHLLGRRLGRKFDGDEHDEFTDEERNTVQVYGNKLYEVGTCQINFTTYDNRRDYDTINPKTHPDVMVLSQDDQQNDQPC
ncbi:hypothetical protein H1R20_g11200, partial [Candolleomyces eurysporus]